MLLMVMVKGRSLISRVYVIQMYLRPVSTLKALSCVCVCVLFCVYVMCVSHYIWFGKLLHKRHGRTRAIGIEIENRDELLLTTSDTSIAKVGPNSTAYANRLTDYRND